MEKLNNKQPPRDKLRILAAGDIHGDANISKRLAEKAVKENVDLVVLTGDMTGMTHSKNLIQPFLDKKKKVIFIPGNWETKQDAKTIADMYGIKNIEDRYVIYKNVGIFGVGSADWSLFPDDAKVFHKLRKQNDKLKNIKNLEKKIMISHLHASGTKSELSGIPGNDGLRVAIEEFQPDLFIHSHIHELEGVEERIGKTRVINVGKHGKIFEI